MKEEEEEGVLRLACYKLSSSFFLNRSFPPLVRESRYLSQVSQGEPRDKFRRSQKNRVTQLQVNGHLIWSPCFLETADINVDLAL
jgi:hypothetical protein